MLISPLVFAQAPFLLPSRGMVQELQAQSQLGWGGIFLASRSYQPVEGTWLTKTFLPRYRKTLNSLRVRGGAESFDCDNFAELFRSELAVESYLAGYASLGEVACAIAVVNQRRSFGRVLSSRNSLHSVVVVRTDEGWKVIEPQTLRVASLDDYPNRMGIEALYF